MTAIKKMILYPGVRELTCEYEIAVVNIVVINYVFVALNYPFASIYLFVAVIYRHGRWSFRKIPKPPPPQPATEPITLHIKIKKSEKFL